MADNRGVWTAIGGSLVALGGGALLTTASGRDDPIFWIGIGLVVVGVAVLVRLLLGPSLADRQARTVRAEQALVEGRANQRAALDEISTELGEMSNQLKRELRSGQRYGMLPYAAWSKNAHVVTGDARGLVEDAYKRAHLLDQATESATQPQLDETETEERREAKQVVDAAAEAVRDLRDRFQP